MRRCSVFFAAAAAAAAPAAPAAVNPSDAKMQALHKILIGEVSFRNNAPVKACNIEHNFGASWQKEIQAYAAKLPAEQKTVLERQIARAALTRYTTRELAQYAGEGPENVDKVAQAANVQQAKALLAKVGDAKFDEYIKAEAKNANWSDADVKKFVDAVKAK